MMYKVLLSSLPAAGALRVSTKTPPAVAGSNPDSHMNIAEGQHVSIKEFSPDEYTQRYPGGQPMKGDGDDEFQSWMHDYEWSHKPNRYATVVAEHDGGVWVRFDTADELDWHWYPWDLLQFQSTFVEPVLEAVQRKDLKELRKLTQEAMQRKDRRLEERKSLEELSSFGADAKRCQEEIKRLDQDVKQEVLLVAKVIAVIEQWQSEKTARKQEMGDNEQKAIEDEHFESAVKPREEIRDAEQFKPGDRVEAFGLTSTRGQGLNYLVGTIKCADGRDSGWWQIDFDNDDDASLNARNLRRPFKKGDRVRNLDGQIQGTIDGPEKGRRGWWLVQIDNRDTGRFHRDNLVMQSQDGKATPEPKELDGQKPEREEASLTEKFVQEMEALRKAQRDEQEREEEANDSEVTREEDEFAAILQGMIDRRDLEALQDFEQGVLKRHDEALQKLERLEAHPQRKRELQEQVEELEHTLRQHERREHALRALNEDPALELKPEEVVDARKAIEQQFEGLGWRLWWEKDVRDQLPGITMERRFLYAPERLQERNALEREKKITAATLQKVAPLIARLQDEREEVQQLQHYQRVARQPRQRREQEARQEAAELENALARFAQLEDDENLARQLAAGMNVNTISAGRH